MRTEARHRILVPMEGTTIVTLELRIAGDLLVGTASSEGTALDFAGWVGLVRALDALLPHAPAPPLRCREEPAATDMPARREQ
jgi:hypothetical protein